MWTSPYRIYLDKEGKPTTKDDEGNTLWSGEWDRQPLSEAVRLGVAEKDGTPIKPRSWNKGETKGESK